MGDANGDTTQENMDAFASESTPLVPSNSLGKGGRTGSQENEDIGSSSGHKHFGQEIFDDEVQLQRLSQGELKHLAESFTEEDPENDKRWARRIVENILQKVHRVYVV